MATSRWQLSLVLLLALTACAASNKGSPTGGNATGGANATGGIPGTGGRTDTGGARTGGTNAAGGAATGGQSDTATRATGGAATGGSSATGGATSFGLTAAQAAAAMSKGVNLGQTFESTQNERTLAAVSAKIDAYYAKGFRNVRIPITWTEPVGGDWLVGSATGTCAWNGTDRFNAGCK
jgi:hypothetical protein